MNYEKECATYLHFTFTNIPFQWNSCESSKRVDCTWGVGKLNLDCSTTNNLVMCFWLHGWCEGGVHKKSKILMLTDGGFLIEIVKLNESKKRGLCQ